MYKAYITPLTDVRPHPNADRLKLATVLGHQVVVGLHNVEGELGVFFPPDGQLSHEMCVHNQLYNKSAAQKLNLTQTSYGFFDANRRVRSQRFRGEQSDGLWLTMNSLTWRGMHDLPAGTAIEDTSICQKYITEATRRATAKASGRVRRGETLMFPKHADTEQFRFYWQDIPEHSVLWITEKLHGTSGRYGLVLEDTNRPWWQFWKPRREWRYLNGSRNVILEHSTGGGFYGTNDFRYDAVKDIELRKGEVIFFELVGYTDTGQLIMPEVSTDDLPDIVARYGKQMRYTYGCNFGETKLYVYRIIQMNEDGEAVELSWPQVERRAKALGLKTVPLLAEPIVVKGRPIFNVFKQWIENLAVGPSKLDERHIREGVCIRVDDPTGKTYVLKEKSFDFRVLEGIVKLDNNYVDMEESS